MTKLWGGIFVSGALLLGIYLAELNWVSDAGQKYQGSPPRRFQKERNDIDLNCLGGPIRLFRKMARVTRYQNSTKEESRFSWYKKKGWLVYEDTTYLEGKIYEMHNSLDGDFHIHIHVDSSYLKYGEKIIYGNPLRDSPDKEALKVEIDWNLRKNFPIFHDLAIGDHIKVKGRYVLDEAHGWKEIHPAYWIDFVETPSIDTIVEKRK